MATIVAAPQDIEDFGSVEKGPLIRWVTADFLAREISCSEKAQSLSREEDSILWIGYEKANGGPCYANWEVRSSSKTGKQYVVQIFGRSGSPF